MITLPRAKAILAKLIEVQTNDPIGAIQSVTVAGHTYSFKNAADLQSMINYWSRVVADLERRKAGRSGLIGSRAVFH